MVLDSFCSSFRSAFSSLRSGVVDFKGQDRVYSMLVYLAWTGSFGGFVAGFLYGDFAVTVYSILISMGIAAVLCIPSWPAYHRHPVEWTPHDPARLVALYTQLQQQAEQQESEKRHQGTGRGGKGKNKQHVELQRKS
ncbi:microsomal signal peptidase domain-containing protein [Cystoisospora suis]|uniref:Signal peptidase complex subunit 1 n=1 Tax=Cystoisospora suis TaxID=483139 RepID=A0A2C6L3Q9_9APIC|nr:microsomal signal peptidase domain-containing protein [Cystoisospora suis]